jgi:hypothetical protein
MSVIATPSEHMVAFDAREQARFRINEVEHSTVGIPTMKFKWKVAAPAPDPRTIPERPPPSPAPVPPAAPQPAENARSNVPAWLTFASGCALVLCALVLPRRPRDRGWAGGRIALAVVGLAVIVAALVRLGVFRG